MLYLKSYCYSQHELPFIIANLDEGFEHIDKLILYEYNFTHTGLPKEYEIEKVLHLIPEHLKTKLLYKKIDLTTYIEYAVNDENKCHQINENIQRSWLFNDADIILYDDDIIIDIDIDEIIYKDCYKDLVLELNKANKPIGIKLNQFFFKNTYLWSNLIFDAPAIYKYNMVKNINKNVKGVQCKYQRYCSQKTSKIYGCHMSWVMPIDDMLKKIYSGAHTKYHHLGTREILEKAIEEKKYVFDLKRQFNITELDITDSRIPSTLQKTNLFHYLS
jgi:hypothetical protein|tara:strand:+ start:1910 stop:2731 length:822 start_codon:yes stop_codon:yes gene_type:complete